MKQNFLLSLLIFSIILIGASASSFAQADTARRTTAVTYPLDEQVMLNFRGTTRFPRMKGEAKIKRTSRNGTEIDLSVSKMPRPFELGPGYATYVLWAISPEGQADNLGEVKRRGFFEFDSKISVTTRLQTFALIITAEPHFLVRRPSAQVMLENLNPYTTSGRSVPTTTAVQYFGNSSDYFRDTRTPEIAELDYSKTPSALLQAKQAVALAKFAGAERDAPTELAEAETLLQNAEGSWRAGRPEEEVDISSRRAISTAVKAENTALISKEAREKRNEKTRSDAEIRRAEAKYTDAQNQMDDLKNELARETRNRELAERDVLNANNQIRDLRDENGKLREELGRMRVELNSAKERLDAIDRERNNQQQQQDAQAREAQMRANEAQLLNSLRAFGTVSKNNDSIVVVVPENWWTTSRSSTFTSSANSKIASFGELLQAYPDYMIAVESHTDTAGGADVVQATTERRAQAIADKFATSGISSSRVSARGLGASMPVAPNTTAANRAKNRRVIITLSMPNGQ